MDIRCIFLTGLTNRLDSNYEKLLLFNKSPMDFHSNETYVYPKADAEPNHLIL